jgi:hypothetical protein
MTKQALKITHDGQRWELRSMPSGTVIKVATSFEDLLYYARIYFGLNKGGDPPEQCAICQGQGA